MFFQKKQPLAISAYLKGNKDLIQEEAERNAQWTSYGGLTPKQIAAHLFEKDISYKIPVYTRGEGKLRFITAEEFETIFQIQHCSQLTFETFYILDDIAKKTKKQQAVPAARIMNNWTKALLLKQRETNKQPLGAIKWINPELGYGVFSYKDLSEYTYIGEYTGVVRKRTPRKDCFNNYVFRYVTGTKDSPYVIDAREKGSFTRFINHSDRPNLTSRWIIIDGITHIVFFTNQFIKRGTQLTYDYGEMYWRSRRFPKLL